MFGTFVVNGFSITSGSFSLFEGGGGSVSKWITDGVYKLAPRLIKFFIHYLILYLWTMR